MKRKSGFRCFECDGRANHAHHVVPFSLGGTRTIPLCFICHDLAHQASGIFTQPADRSEAQSQRIKSGMRQARESGVHVGRPRKEDLDDSAIKYLFELGWKKSHIAKELKTTPTLVAYRLRKMGLCRSEKSSSLKVNSGELNIVGD